MTQARRGELSIRATLIDFTDDPAACASRGDSAASACRIIEDGLLVVRDGRIVARAPWTAALAASTPARNALDLRGSIVMPGFIDAHVHYPQLDVIASPGTQLLEWLERYTFVAEQRFADAAYARDTAAFFLDELLRNGTTTAVIFGTVHPESADAIFAAGLSRSMRIIAGKVMMDRNCPPALADTARQSEADSLALIRRWHGQGRLAYAVTPRFAGTSSPDQLEAAARLYRGNAGVYLQSHVAENLAEIEWIRSLFPDARSYLDVYDRYGLLGERAVYAHGIHVDAADRERLAATRTAIAFSPTSNLFLGSGLFDVHAAARAGQRVALASDVGGGTSLSMLRTLQGAYQVSAMRGEPLDAFTGFHMVTRGAALALGLAGTIGTLDPGVEADVVVLDPGSLPVLERRYRLARDWSERLFALMMLGDDRTVSHTYVMGALRGAASGR
jgi:guanine deaminase